MNKFIDYSSQLQQELEMLPRDYSLIMARGNRDVVIHSPLNYNLGRFLIFLDNYYKEIPDKVRITTFGIDGPPTTSILLYDGNYLTYVVDGTRFQTRQWHIYHGKDMIIRKRDWYKDVILDYNLITLDGDEIPILHVWAGLEPVTR